jgi:hypothetical protein
MKKTLQIKIQVSADDLETVDKHLYGDLDYFLKQLRAGETSGRSSGIMEFYPHLYWESSFKLE